MPSLVSSSRRYAIIKTVQKMSTSSIMGRHPKPSSTTTTRNKPILNSQRKRREFHRFYWSVVLGFGVAAWSLLLRGRDLARTLELDTSSTSSLLQRPQPPPTHQLTKQDDDDDDDDPYRQKICFLQSVFGEPTHPSLDQPHNVTTLRQENPNFDFFYFTNMATLDTPGWTKILMTELPYKRHITMSRLPKFLAWKIHPPIRETCKLVLYMDGQFRPRTHKAWKFQNIATQVTRSDYGLVQLTHPKGGSLTDELDRIVSGTKDTQAHADASLAWLQSQPDWNDNSTLYWNAVFGYDPTHPVYQQASEFFWDRFRQELDSWRDQPLWAYTLNHFGIVPLTMRHDTLHSYIIEDFDLKGDHHYNESTVSYAKKQNPSIEEGE